MTASAWRQGYRHGFHSALIGVTAWESCPPLTHRGVAVEGELTGSQLREMSDQLAEVGEHFRANLTAKMLISLRQSADAI